MDEKKLVYYILLAFFLYSLIIPVRLFFSWPLANYWDYASHITGTKIMAEYGCTGIENWTGYNICTKNAPGFYVTSTFFSLFFGVKTGFVVAIFFYILLFYQLATRVFKENKLAALSVIGTPLAFWWFFKVGRVLEMSATLFAALFFMTKDKRLKVLFSALAVIHHPAIIIPLVLLSGKDIVSALGGMAVVFPYLFFLLQNTGFTKWAGAFSPVNFLNLLQAAPFVFMSVNLSPVIPVLFGEALFCSGTGICLLKSIPIIKNTYAASLTPLLIFLVFKKLLKKKQYKKILIALILSSSIFLAKEAYYVSTQGVPGALLPMEEHKAWLESNLKSINQTFDYKCTKVNYPSPMMASGYAYLEYELDSVKSPFPEFIDKSNLKQVCDGCTIECT